MQNYRKIHRLGEGAHGVVNLCEYQGGEDGVQDDPSHSSSAAITTTKGIPLYVAIKQIRLRTIEGLSIDAIRELKFLFELKHPNIIDLHDVFVHKTNLNLVMEYMHTDLSQIIRNRQSVLIEADIKQFLSMLLRAVAQCHANWILHRDIKPGNCLVNERGILKLGDFGLAKLYGSPNREMSSQACTLWYRAPELLFGASTYGPASDIWSIGCVFGEMMTRYPLFQGKTELDQLAHIFAVLGTPSPKTWPGVDALPHYVQFEASVRTPFETVFPAASPEAIDLISRMLEFNPLKRLSASEALEHAFFNGAATSPEDLPLPNFSRPEDYIKPRK